MVVQDIAPMEDRVDVRMVGQEIVPIDVKQKITTWLERMGSL